MICVLAVTLIGVEVVFATPAPLHPREFGDTPTTSAGSVAAWLVLAAFTAARFAAPLPSVIALGKTQLLLASLISATFCAVPVESFTVNGLGQAASAAVHPPKAASRAAAAQILVFTSTLSCLSQHRDRQGIASGADRVVRLQRATWRGTAAEDTVTGVIRQPVKGTAAVPLEAVRGISHVEDGVRVPVKG